MASWRFRITQAFRGKIKSLKIGQSYVWPISFWALLAFPIYHFAMLVAKEEQDFISNSSAENYRALLA